MEKWKDIPGYDGLYEASTDGRIRTHRNKTTLSARHGVRHWKQRILRPKACADQRKCGYRVALYKDGVAKAWLVARLVAMTWAPGYENSLTVNHKNGDRLDNRIENLEWVSLGDNIRHGFETGLYTIQISVQVEAPDGQVATFRSMAEASRWMGRCHGYVSNRLKRGSRFTPDGYKISLARQCHELGRQ